jgi:outer membrane protein
MKMKKTLLSVLIASSLLPVFAHAEAGDWVVRLRAVNVNPNEDSKLGTTVNKALGGPIMSPGAKLEVDNNTIPELDISYYFTKNIAAELILAIGTSHDVKVKGDSGAVVGNQALGSVNLLPPTLTAQWHFMPDQTFDPYLGAGVTYSLSLDNKLAFTSGAVKGSPIRVDRSMFGPALQAGFDINLKDGWLINADVKYAWLSTDVRTDLGAGYVKIDDLDINPWVFGIGIGKKF